MAKARTLHDLALSLLIGRGPRIGVDGGRQFLPLVAILMISACVDHGPKPVSEIQISGEITFNNLLFESYDKPTDPHGTGALTLSETDHPGQAQWFILETSDDNGFRLKTASGHYLRVNKRAFPPTSKVAIGTILYNDKEVSQQSTFHISRVDGGNALDKGTKVTIWTLRTGTLSDKRLYVSAVTRSHYDGPFSFEPTDGDRLTWIGVTSMGAGGNQNCLQKLKAGTCTCPDGGSPIHDHPDDPDCRNTIN